MHSGNVRLFQRRDGWFRVVAPGFRRHQLINVLQHRKRGLPAAPVCSGLELFFTSEPLRVLVMVVDSGVVLLSTLSPVQASNPTRRAFVTCGPHVYQFLNADQHLQVPIVSVASQRHNPLLPCSASYPLLKIPVWPLATSIGIDGVASVPATTLNVTRAVPLIGGMCISTTHSSQSSSLCNWLHLPTQFQECALSMALCNRSQYP